MKQNSPFPHEDIGHPD